MSPVHFIVCFIVIKLFVVVYCCSTCTVEASVLHFTVPNAPVFSLPVEVDTGVMGLLFSESAYASMMRKIFFIDKY